VRIAAAVVALLTIGVEPSLQNPAAIVLRKHFAPGGLRYQYLPFDVSADTASITIACSYTGDDGSSVIDVGLFEPGPLTIGTPAFRGYSGGNLRTITVGRRTASPGYRTGPLPAGTWHVMLGMYRVAPAGVDVEITIAQTRDEPPPSAPPDVGTRGSSSEKRDRSDQPKWYSGALHLHTRHSDGTLTPAALADAARDAGYDFIAITDHNNTTHTREPMPSSPLHLIGEEVTTPGGHATVWGLPEGAWIDFRVAPRDPGAADAVAGLVDAAHRAGALFSISHPIDNCDGCSWTHAIPEGVDAIEIWQYEQTPREAEIAVWDRLLREGRRITAVGVSDWHRRPEPIDTAAVRVLASSLTQPAVLEGIKQGRVIVMRDVRTLPPSVRARCGSADAGVGETLTCAANDDLEVHVSMPELSGADAEFTWNAARMTTRTIGHGTTFTMPAAAGYVRVRIRTANGRTVAITNPIYVSMR
jgi:PHP domain